MARSKSVAAATDITRAILVLRGHKVLLDADLAVRYGLTSKRLNEQVKRNAERFPEDFMFRLTKPECHCDEPLLRARLRALTRTAGVEQRALAQAR